MKPAIRVDNLSKRYRLGTSKSAGYRTLRETITESAAGAWHGLRRRLGGSVNGNGSDRDDAFWALKDVSFEVQPGEVVGIIGRNGAGKSTLLKIIGRITEPASGRLEVRGRVGSLLEVGTGFHPELSGRENIYLNGSILGMKRSEIEKKFDAIVAFSEMEQFLDTPVKRYSSGMFVRLAFAVAANLEPEILIVDEVLAVGDVAFQKKCLGKINEVSKCGRTVLFVSHNLGMLRSLCNSILLLGNGRLVFQGDCEKGLDHYSRKLDSTTTGEVNLITHPRRRNGRPSIFHKISVYNEDKEITDQLHCGEPITVEFQVAPILKNTKHHFCIKVEDSMGATLFTLATFLSDSGPISLDRHETVTCKIPELPLSPGRYSLSLEVGPPHIPGDGDVIDQAVWFDVHPAPFHGNGQTPPSSIGPFLVRSCWDKVS